MYRQVLIVAALTCIVLATGCKRTRVTAAARAPGSGSISRNDKSAWFVIDGDGVPVVVWAETISSSSGSSGDGRVQGSLRRSDGKSIVLDYRADAGTLNIDGAPHDLANGAVFLLYSAQSPPRVVQLRHGPLQTSDPVKAVNDLGRDDPDVRQFLQQANAPAHTTATSSPSDGSTH